MRRVLHHILSILRLGALSNAICYDCACTLKLFIDKHFGTDNLKSTDFTEFLTSINMTIDRFHIKNHKCAMYKTTMRSDHECYNDIYDLINIQVAEQGFSYLSKFKNSFLDYNYLKSTIFFMILFHLKNCAIASISSFVQPVQELLNYNFFVLFLLIILFHLIIYRFQKLSLLFLASYSCKTHW